MARTAEQSNGDDEEYSGVDTGVKLQTEWLPVEGTVPEFFAHLSRSLDAYLSHSCKLRLSSRVDKCAERASIINPAANRLKKRPSRVRNVGLVFEKKLFLIIAARIPSSLWPNFALSIV